MENCFRKKMRKFESALALSETIFFTNFKKQNILIPLQKSRVL